MKIIRIPSLYDNYIWLLYNSKKKCIVIDPGESYYILKIIEYLNLKLTAILLTHHHNDHTYGINTLLNDHTVTIYGPKETIKNGTTKVIKEGDTLHLIDHDFHIIELPGHTTGHIGFYIKPWLFCGDTLFTAGCGKIIEGTAKQMYESIEKIKNLPKSTIICSGHEYTIANLKFASYILPNNNNIKYFYNKIKHLKIKQTIITSLNIELKINPFLISNNIYIKNNKIINFIPRKAWEVFAELRKRKDKFNEQITTIIKMLQ